jgi:hypothetical protein
MKNSGYLIICFLISFIFSSTVIAQHTGSISGKVFDASTKSPIPFAVVFLKNTTLGGSSDPEGNYEIKNIPPGEYELVFAQAAYETQSKTISINKNTKLKENVFLKVKIHSLEEVTILAQESKEWKKNLVKFTKEFIGSTRNSDETRILNPEVINFYYNPKTEIFSASTDSNIVLENRAMGYKMYIVLTKFQIEDRAELMRYVYYPRFEELTPKDDAEKTYWLEKRRSCYRGSLKHFLISLIGHNLNDDGFTIQGSTGPYTLIRETILPKKITVTTEDSTYYEIDFGYPCIHVSYLSGNTDYSSSYKLESSLFIQLNKLLISKYGQIIAPREPVQFGHWSKMRMADNLPLDYQYSPE